MNKSAVFLIVFGLLGACAQAPAPPVINKSPSRYIPEAYEVKHGDSIYTIAWGVGLDFLDIAEWNKLKKPYTLQPRQTLRLRKPPQRITPKDASSPNLYEPKVSRTLPTVKPSPKIATDIAAAPSVKFSSAPSEWNWPAEGKLIGKYAPSNGSNGIQIGGVDGSPVRATAAGEIVYVGQGLRGYGKLIILKHSKKYLSAYAHNREILVKEGQIIKPGQQIAKMGRSGTKSTMLHFEIRVDGNPVDPLTYLK